MKKIQLFIVTLLAVVMLTGCGNTYASVSNKKDVLIQYGNTTITKGDLYNSLMIYDAGDYVAKQAAIMIVNAEVETTDAIKESANKQLEALKTTYGDLDKTLDYLGYDSEEELLSDIIASVKAQEVINSYFEANYETICKTYNPLKVRIIKITTETDEKETFEERAALALAEIKAGADFQEVANKYCNATNAKAAAETLVTTKSDLDKKVSTYLETVTTPGLSDVFLSNDGKSAFIVQVTVNNLEQLKEDFKSAYGSISGVTTEIYAALFKKHNFTIYDKTTYDLFKANYPEYIGE